MSTRGRKAELQVIEGGFNVPDDVPDDVPKHIPEDMRGEWLAVVADLKERRILTDAMLPTIGVYISALHNERKAQEAIAEHGVLIKGRDGVLTKNPAVTLLGKSQSTTTRLAAELGLTPAARSRKVMKDEPDDGGMNDLFQL